MAEEILSTGIAYFADPSKGRPVFNGSVYVGQPGLDPKVFANRVDVILVQQNGLKITLSPSSQPFLTGAGGQILYNGSAAVIKVIDEVSVRVDNNNGQQVNYNPRFNETTAATELTQSLFSGILSNGSFEFEESTGVPVNWNMSVASGSIISTDSESNHGIRSLRFLGVDTSGAGTATSDKFNVTENGSIDVRFSYRSISATTHNEVRVNYYNGFGASISVDTLLTNSTTNPLSYTSFILRSNVPTGATRAELVFDGVKSTGDSVSTTYFDGASVDYVIDNAVVRNTSVDSAVNSIIVSNAITGANPTIDVIGEDVGLDIEGVTLENGAITGNVVGDILGDIIGNVTGDVTGDLFGTADNVLNPNLTGPVSTSGLITTINPITIGSAHIKTTLAVVENNTILNTGITLIPYIGFIYVLITEGGTGIIATIDVLINGVWVAVADTSPVIDVGVALFSTGTNIRIDNTSGFTSVYSVERIID